MTIDRRKFLAGAGVGLAGLTGGVVLDRVVVDRSGTSDRAAEPGRDAAERVAFRGNHQAGIDTAGQRYATFAAFDVTKRDRAAMAGLMSTWTEVAEQLTSGKTVAEDSGEATGMGPARLTLTFGFGASLFDDACAPKSSRPAGLVDLPEFEGDELEDQWNGGDVIVQACADDPTVVSHALRQLRRSGQGTVALRWAQNGFLPQASGETPRNLFGQVDGTGNPPAGSDELGELVWVTDGPDWMHGGTYLATRRIRMMLTMWDRMGIDVQDESLGRRRDTGAPLTGGDEFTALNLDANVDGKPVIAPDAHVRLAKVSGPGMLRRGYSYDNGPRVAGQDASAGGGTGGPNETNGPDHSQHGQDGQMNHSAMRAMMDDHDAGLFFAAYVADPEAQFIPTQHALSAADALGHFLAYTSAGLWAIPAGTTDGPIGGDLFA